MLSFLFKNKDKRKEEAKKLILKEFFNSADQKRAVFRAAKESAEDQRMLVVRYRKLVGQ